MHLHSKGNTEVVVREISLSLSKDSIVATLCMVMRAHSTSHIKGIARDVTNSVRTAS